MRIMIGRFSEESNSFAPQQAGDEDFWISVGDRILKNQGFSRNTEIAGFLDVLMRRRSIQVIPAVDARALPNGCVRRETYERIKELFLRTLTQSDRVDGVLLALHGAMQVEELGDGEGDFLETLRDYCGPDVPIVATLDLHAVVTQKMVKNATAFVGYRTAPHTDMYAVGSRAANLLLQLLDTKASCSMAFRKIPMIVPGEKAESAEEPMRSLLRRIDELEQNSDVLSVSLFIGNAWIDDEESGVSTIAVGKTPTAAESAAQMLANEVWAKRFEFSYPSYAKVVDPDSAIEAAWNALRSGRSPVIMVDSGDNPTAGAPGDSTFLLRKVLNAGIPDATVISIVDPEALAACVEAGIGKKLILTLGGKIDRTGGPPINIQCVVEKVADANSYFTGDPTYDQSAKGRAVVVKVQDTRTEIIITEKRVNNTDPKFPRSLGIEPTQRSLLLIKDSYCTDEYRRMAQEWLLVLTPGATQQMLETLNYRRIRRPIFPLDKGILPKW